MALGLVERADIIQREVGAGGTEGFDQVGLARLARTGDYRHGQYFQGGFELSDKPARSNGVRAVNRSFHAVKCNAGLSSMGNLLCRPRARLRDYSGGIDSGVRMPLNVGAMVCVRSTSIMMQI
jgi:hypothetical protein